MGPLLHLWVLPLPRRNFAAGTSYFPRILFISAHEAVSLAPVSKPSDTTAAAGERAAEQVRHKALSKWVPEERSETARIKAFSTKMML